MIRNASYELTGLSDIESVEIHHFCSMHLRSLARTEAPSRNIRSVLRWARSLEFDPKIRSTLVAVHFTSPVARSRPSNKSHSSDVGTPLCTHIEQVHKEVVTERTRPVCKNTRAETVRYWHQAHATHQQVLSFQAL